MNVRLQRILIFFAALIAALLVVLIVVLLTADSDGDDAASATVTTETTDVPEATEAPADEVPPAEDPPAEDPPAEDPPAEEPPAEEPPAEDPPPEEDPPPAEEPPPPEAMEVGRTTVELNNGVPLGGVDSDPPFIVSLGTTGFLTSHPWHLVSVSQPGLEGCMAADTTGDGVANPIELQMLGAFASNWYGCSDMGDDHLAQLHIILVEEDPDRVIVEVVVWDTSP